MSNERRTDLITEIVVGLISIGVVLMNKNSIIKKNI